MSVLYGTIKYLNKLPEVDRTLVCPNVVGGFQTEAAKSNWVSNHEATCPLCTEVDDHAHRVLKCPALALARSKHPVAVQTLQEDRTHWSYEAIATASSEQVFLSIKPAHLLLGAVFRCHDFVVMSRTWALFLAVILVQRG